MKTLVVIGSGSRIGRELAVLAAREGWAVIATRRDLYEAARDASDIAIRSASPSIDAAALRLESPETFPAFIENCVAHRAVHGLFIATGMMPLEDDLASDSELFAQMAIVNYSGVASLLDQIVVRLPREPGAFISCLTSVAGDRGRASNFRYGSTKAALSTFLEGLSLQAEDRGLLIQDVKLGPVDTPLNSEVTRMPFAIPPEVAAKQIWRALRRRSAKVYVPAKWWWIMLVIRLSPRALYRRLRV